MTASAEHYEDVIEDSGIDTESLTLVVASDASREEVAEALGIDLSTRQDVSDLPEDLSGYALLEVAGGVLALEPTGYADPSLEALRRLSAPSRAVAVVRSNIQAHTRFGAARDGEVVFDAHQYTFVDDLDTVPAELRPLFDLAWVDPEDVDADPEADDVAVGLAMAEVVTGVALTAADLSAVWAQPFFRAPSLVYGGD